MRLSWNEVRVRAAGFAQEWWNTVRERSETQSFYNEFFEIFGVKRRSVARYEQHVKKLDNHSGFIDLFWPGVLIVEQKSAGRDLSRAYDQAAELVGRLHDALHAAGYQGHDLERFLVRIVFCLFADDTGIFEPRDIFLDFIETRTGEDGSDTGARLMELFQVLDTPETYRQKTRDEDLSRFPYINGDLFDGPLRIPAFDAAMRGALLDACRFDWSNISPAIFGALFQSIMNPAERRAQGAHYTTEKNILKVIEPLFMDDLLAEFARLKSRKHSRRLGELQRFQKKLGQMRFFDPACGCGNFLIIAYRELRALEIEVLKEIHQSGQWDALAEDLSVINVDQFYGIELGEFPARIAETALWMMDHIMNNRLSLEFGQIYARIPLMTSPLIVHGDALETDWAELLPPEECSFVFGNPPFVGAKFQTAEQRAQVRGIAALGKTGGTLDYVTAWFIKAGKYVQTGKARIGFVATNSITQGEQVAQLWPILFDRCKLEIGFAHRTFAWGSDARGKAHVHVVIIGLDQQANVRADKRLFSYLDINGEPEETSHAALSPYLFDAGGLANPHLTVCGENRPINGMRQLIIGSKPIDGGHYIFDANDRTALLEAEPDAVSFLRLFVGAQEFLQRWRTLDTRSARRSTKYVSQAAPYSGTYRLRPRLSPHQQERPYGETGGNTDALSCECPTHRPIPGHSRGQFRATGVRAYRLAGTAHDSKQPRSRS